LNDRHQLIPVSYVIFLRGDAVLLQRRQRTGYLDGHWATAAAGHVEAHETALDAACREAREELGLVISPEDLVPLVVMHRQQEPDEGDAGRVDFFFQCTEWSGEPRLMEGGKASDLGWFPLGDLPLPLVPHEHQVLSSLRSGSPAIISFGFPAAQPVMDNEPRAV